MQFEISGLLIKIDPLAPQDGCTKPCTLPYSSCETGTIRTHIFDKVLDAASKGELQQLREVLAAMQHHLDQHGHKKL